MHQLLLSISASDSLTLYGGGAIALGAMSALIFIVSLFGKRAKKPTQQSARQNRVIGPAAGAGGAGGGEKLMPPEESVVQIDEDDPRMAAAVTEAKKRWPEFVGAFGKAKDG